MGLWTSGGGYILSVQVGSPHDLGIVLQGIPGEVCIKAVNIQISIISLIYQSYIIWTPSN